MDLKNIKTAYFLGIGGIGMSAIARYFNHLGIKVMGYDKTPTALTNELIKEGIDIHFDDNVEKAINYQLSTDNCLVVLTPAIPANHQEWAWFKNNGFNILKRSQVLGLISQNHQTIGVAGTHGKTTTSTLIAHILKQSSVDCSAFLGGISTNYNTNFNDTPIVKAPNNSVNKLIFSLYDENNYLISPTKNWNATIEFS